MSEDSRSRRLYFDWARGVAVLLMIQAHTFDAWTRPDARATQIFRNLTILGGLAAPLFLWLAGVGVAMSAAGAARRSGSRAAGVDKVCRRGLEIFILAFLFRLQAFIVSPGSHPVTLFRVDILNIMGPSMAVAAVIFQQDRIAHIVERRAILPGRQRAVGGSGEILECHEVLSVRRDRTSPGQRQSVTSAAAPSPTPSSA